MCGKGLDISTTLKQSYHPTHTLTHIADTLDIKRYKKKNVFHAFSFISGISSANSTLSPPRNHSQCHKIITAHAGITRRKETENDSPNCSAETEILIWVEAMVYLLIFSLGKRRLRRGRRCVGMRGLSTSSYIPKFDWRKHADISESLGKKK